MDASARLRLAVDIGGTFTDTVLMAGADTVLATTKVPTTPANPAEGARAGAARVLSAVGHDLAAVEGFIHGTTLATNALIERRGATVACVLTEGFRDILEIAYERRYSQYDIDIDKPDLIVPRERCFTVPERMAVDGRVIAPLDTARVDRLVAEIDACGAEAVAICLLHAYANPAHERQLRDLIAARRPGLSISLSSEVSPEAREFERLCTTVANAYIRPLMARYLANFADAFARDGLTCPILMMTAGGGMTTIETAAQLPIRLVESGPAGGAILAARVASSLGLDEILSFDMGGTTAKLCLIDGARPQTSRAFEISRAARFVKGSGIPVRIPVIDMIEIGAGGGSIAAVDRLGRLTVGPHSAGSDPGPVAFGRGGTHPTVTDGDVTMGLIDPDAFAEGRLTLDPKAARHAIAEDIAGPLALGEGAAAAGISDIVAESMAGAGRMHAVESGKDLGTRTMIAFGGNGPLHATRVARRAGVSRILIPPDPGVGSALGFLFAPVSFELVRSLHATLDALPLARLNALLDAMTAEAEGVVRAGAPDDPIEFRRSAFMRYHGQGHEIEIDLPDRTLREEDVPDLRAAFDAAYSRLYSRAVPGMRIEILNWGLRASTPSAPADPTPTSPPAFRAEPVGHRSIRCDLTGARVEAAVHARARLTPGARFAGPALIQETQTTTFVSADFTGAVDALGNLILTRREDT